MLRTLFGRSKAHRALAARGAAARLGIACHAVLEEIGKGALDSLARENWIAAIDSLWSDAIEDQRRDAAQSRFDAINGPPERWPYYNLRWAQVHRVGVALAESRVIDEPAPDVADFPPGESGIEAERGLHGFSGRLRGQADRISKGPSGVCIDDYKTGAIFQHVEDASEIAAIKDDYRLQLLLYAALYHEETGVWPTTARLIPLQGEPVTVQVDPSEADAAALEALGLLERYNAVSAATKLQELATPSPENCSTCAYRGACDAYWQSARTDWNPPDQPSCDGTVAGIDRLGDGSILLVLHAMAGNLAPGRLRVRGLSPEQVSRAGNDLKASDRVRLVRLGRYVQDDPGEIWSGPWTEVWIVPQV